MKKLFCSTTAVTNEEYKQILKTKMELMGVLFVLGIVTILVTLTVPQHYNLKLSDYMRGLYSGVGTGLLAASIILFVKHYRTYRDEERIKKERIECMDERNEKISSCAARAALIVLFILMYAVMLFGGLWHPVLSIVMCLMVCMYLIAYCIFYKIYSDKF